MSNDYPVEIDGATGEVDTLSPTKDKRYRCKLDSLADVKAEMAKVYRESRSSIIDPVTGTKFIWMLIAVQKAIEGSDLEKRIEILEQKK
ncbi:MAG: hypothetical protein WCG16_10420 [Methylococcales bacterium]